MSVNQLLFRPLEKAKSQALGSEIRKNIIFGIGNRFCPDIKLSLPLQQLNSIVKRNNLRWKGNDGIPFFYCETPGSFLVIPKPYLPHYFSKTLYSAHQFFSSSLDTTTLIIPTGLYTVGEIEMCTQEQEQLDEIYPFFGNIVYDRKISAVMVGVGALDKSTPLFDPMHFGDLMRNRQISTKNPDRHEELQETVHTANINFENRIFLPQEKKIADQSYLLLSERIKFLTQLGV